MKFQKLAKEELVAINGGSEATDSFWRIVGFIAHAIYAFSQGAAKGGYAQCKCP